MTTESRKLAVVTGASSGIGRELAVQFAAHDVDLVLCAEDAGLAAVAEGAREAGATVTEVQRDLRSTEGVEELYAAVVALGRPVDAAAVNAGVGRGGVFWETPLADLFEVVDLNVRSTMHLTPGVGAVAADLLDRVDDAGDLPGGLQRVEVVRAVLR